jgi:DNA-binding transcriptional regulator YiaG
MTQSAKIKQLNQILSALEKFQVRKNSLFSLDKLAEYLKLSASELEDILKLIFRFQQLFSSNFDGYYLCKKWRNDNTYLVLKPKSEGKDIRVLEPKEIEIAREQVKLLSDIAYYFQRVKIGKGFDLKRNGTELSRKVKELKKSHPYFFESKGNGLVYPSKLAVDAGNLILSYDRSKRSFSQLKIGDYTIKIIP